MTKTIITFLAAMLFALPASSALAAFADPQLIRIVYERTTGTDEQASAMGNVSTLIASGGNFVSTLPVVTTPTNLFAAYWALNRTTNELWVSGSTDTSLAPAAVGTLGFNTTKSASTSIYTYYNSNLVTADANGVLSGLQAYPSSYRLKMSPSQGSLANGITIATRVNTEASLAELVNGTAPVKLQNLYYFANANTANSKGVKVAVIANHADGSTTILSNAAIAADATPPTVDSLVLPTTSDSNASVALSAFSASDDSGVVAGYLITETNVKPSATATGWSETPPASYTFTTPVPYGIPTPVTLYAWVKDLNGNVSPTSLSATVNVTAIDRTSPKVTALVVPATATNPTINGITFTATDDVAVTGYLLNDTGIQPAINDPAWSATAPTSFTFITNLPLVGDPPKTMTIYAWAKDASGNIGTMTNIVNLTISAGDTTAPSVTISTPAPLSATNATVDIAFTATDDTGVTEYLLNESATPPVDLVTGWTTVTPSISFSGNASYTFASLNPGASTASTLYVWSKDAAGNVSSPAGIATTIYKPAKITGLAPPAEPYFMLIQDALTAVANGDNVLTMSASLTEASLVFDRPGITANLIGGYDSGYSAAAGATTIQGTFRIRNGRLNVNGLALK